MGPLYWSIKGWWAVRNMGDIEVDCQSGMEVICVGLDLSTRMLFLWRVLDQRIAEFRAGAGGRM